MNEQEFKVLCSAVAAGWEKRVEHLETHYTGRVLRCWEKRIEVDVAGRRESWAMESCEETMGSRYGHREKTLDTHPWDIDRFNPYR